MSPRLFKDRLVYLPFPFTANFSSHMNLICTSKVQYNSAASKSCDVTVSPILFNKYFWGFTLFKKRIRPVVRINLS